jgi:hypothetical protein
MSYPYFVIGTNAIELAGVLHPLMFGYALVTSNGTIENFKLINWTKCFPGPSDPAYRRPPPGGARLSEADWERALAGANVPDWLDRGLIRQGHSPRSALAWLRRHLTVMQKASGCLVVHSHWPDVPALWGAVDRWLRRPMPEVQVSFTDQLEKAARLGLRPRSDEGFDEFNARLENRSEAPTSLEECLRRRGLDAGVPPDHPLYRTHATRVLYADLLPHFEECSSR